MLEVNKFNVKEKQRNVEVFTTSLKSENIEISKNFGGNIESNGT